MSARAAVALAAVVACAPPAPVPSPCEPGVVVDEAPAAAIHVVVVGRGFDPAAIVADLRADAASIVGRAPDLFAFHVVDDRCDDDADRIDATRARALARRAPAVDVIVVVQSADAPRATSERRRPDGAAASFVRATDGAATWDHELGHALVGLADEYGAEDACFTDGREELLPAPWTDGPPGLLDAPNVTTDEEGRAWAGLVDGTNEGGAGAARCVFHPAAPCRMRTPGVGDGYCPVCAARIDGALAAFAQGENAAPDCALELDGPPDARDAATTAAVRGYDVDGVTVELVVDDVVVANGGGGVFARAAAVVGAGPLVARCVDGRGAVVERRLD